MNKVQIEIDVDKLTYLLVEGEVTKEDRSFSHEFGLKKEYSYDVNLIEAKLFSDCVYVPLKGVDVLGSYNDSEIERIKEKFLEEYFKAHPEA